MKRQKGRVLAASVLAAGMAMATTVTVNRTASLRARTSGVMRAVSAGKNRHAAPAWRR